MVLWAASSMASVYYFTSEFKTHTLHDKISLIPYLYLFFLVWIAFIPLIKLNYKIIEKVYVNSVLFKYISILIIILSVVTIVPNTKYFISHMLDPTAFLDAYEDKNRGAQQIVTGFAVPAMNLLKHMKGLIPLFLIMSFTTLVKVKNWIRVGLGLALINLFLHYLDTSSRYALLTDLLLIIFVFFLLYPFIKKSSRKVINVIGLFMLVLLLGGVFMITFSRIGESEESKYIYFNLCLYFGESFTNFNGDLWNITSFTDGNNCFKYFLNRFSDGGGAGRDIDLLEALSHRRMFVFYTFIGDFFVDFGATITAMIIIFLSWLFTTVTRMDSEISFGKLLFLCLYVKVLFVGYTYWTYLNYSMEIVFTILFGLLFDITYNVKKRKLV